MPSISAADVKRLRDATGAGMLDAKNALTEADGDFDRATELLRIKGAGRAAKRGAERSASNGLVVAEGTAMVEVACETDFVAKNQDFQRLAADIVSVAAAGGLRDVDALNEARLPGGDTVAEAIERASGVIGEKLELRQVAYFDGPAVTYLHRRDPDLPPQLGVLVEYAGEDSTAARGAAMQIAAMRPRYVTRDDVPAEVTEHERRIAEATAREEGKPEQALPRIVDGRLNGFYKEAVLVDQPSVTDPKRAVRELLADADVTVTRFARFEVGQA